MAVQGSLSERESVVEARRLRYKLQDASRRILYSFHGDNVPLDNKGRQKHHRTCNCNRSIVSPTVQIVKSSKHNKAFFSGVATCANARVCPVCAAPINERKANEMRSYEPPFLIEDLGCFLFILIIQKHLACKNCILNHS